MAALPNVPNVLEVALKFTYGGDTNIVTKFHFRYTGGPPSTANLTTMAASIEAAWNTNFVALYPAFVVLTQITVQDLTDRTLPIGVWSGSLPGTRGTNTFTPASLAVVVSKSIPVRYRGGHPRSYLLIGGDGDYQGPGTWKSSFTTSVKTAYDAFITAVKAAGAGCTIAAESAISYYHGGNWVGGHWHPTLRTTPQVNDVQGTTVRARIGSQRRRLRKA